MAYLDTPDTVIASLTKEGRNLLARAKVGVVTYRQLGWQLGREGYLHGNPVKIIPIADTATSSLGYIEILANTFDSGDKVTLNGIPFEYTVKWNAGLSIAITAANIVDAINDSRDLGHYNSVQVDIDPSNVNRLRFTSTVTGNTLNGKVFTFPFSSVVTSTNTINYTNHGLANATMVQFESNGFLPNGISANTDYFIANVTANSFQVSSTLNVPSLVNITSQGFGTHSIIPKGNLFPINVNELDASNIGATTNFLVTPMSLPTSIALLDPSYPVPSALGLFEYPEGSIEQPTSSSISFVMRIPEGTAGIGAYGEVGIWAEVLESFYPMEKGRRVLFAHAHYPIQVKTDRNVLTMRVLINY